MRISECFFSSLMIFHALLLRGESFALSAKIPSRLDYWKHHGHHHHHHHQRRQRDCSTNSLFLSQRGGDKAEFDTPKEVPKNHIEVSSQIELPFSAEIAFDAFSDLPRQSSWSPWLKSVQYVQEGSKETKWTMKSILGVSYSWNAISTKLERPYVIEWESSKGLRNWGRVEFVPQSADAAAMQLTLTFVAPRVVARFFQNRDGGLSQMVQNRIVGRTLRNFCQVVLEEDLGRKASKEKELVSTCSS